MTIEIHQPELEALIHQRMESGRFQTVEDVLLEALRKFSDDKNRHVKGATGRALIEAMQACPYPEVDLEPSRPQMPVSDPVSF